MTFGQPTPPIWPTSLGGEYALNPKRRALRIGVVDGKVVASLWEGTTRLRVGRSVSVKRPLTRLAPLRLGPMFHEMRRRRWSWPGFEVFMNDADARRLGVSHRETLLAMVRNYYERFHKPWQ